MYACKECNTESSQPGLCKQCGGPTEEVCDSCNKPASRCKCDQDSPESHEHNLREEAPTEDADE